MLNARAHSAAFGRLFSAALCFLPFEVVHSQGLSSLPATAVPPGEVGPVPRGLANRGSCLIGSTCVFLDAPFSCDFENALRIAEAGGSAGQQLGDDLVRAGRCSTVPIGQPLISETTRSSKVIYVTSQGQHVGYVPVGLFATASSSPQSRDDKGRASNEGMIWYGSDKFAAFGVPDTDERKAVLSCENGSLFIRGPFPGNATEGTTVSVSFGGLGRSQTVQARIVGAGDGPNYMALVTFDSVIVSTLLVNEPLEIYSNGSTLLIPGNGAPKVQSVVRNCAGHERSVSGSDPARLSSIQPAFGTLPRFQNFRVPVYRGPSVAPVLDTEAKWTFRTRLREGTKGPVNFAGRYHLVSWGCGTSCISGALVDALTGHVAWISEIGGRPSEAPDDVYNDMDAQPGSSLLILKQQYEPGNYEKGVRNDAYIFDGSQLRRISTVNTPN